MRKFLRLKQVIEVTGLSRSTIYAAIAAGEFPKPIPLSEKAVAFAEDEVAAWQAARLAKREALLEPKRAHMAKLGRLSRDKRRESRLAKLPAKSGRRAKPAAKGKAAAAASL